MKYRLLIFCIVIGLASQSQAKKCTGEFVNPFNDINWECLFPITMGSMELIGSKDGLKDTPNPGSPVCICPKGGIPMPGHPFGVGQRIVHVQGRFLEWSGG